MCSRIDLQTLESLVATLGLNDHALTIPKLNADQAVTWIDPSGRRTKQGTKRAEKNSSGGRSYKASRSIKLALSNLLESHNVGWSVRS